MIWYNGNVAYDKVPVANIKVTTLFGLLQYRYIYRDDPGSGLFFLGIKLKKNNDLINAIIKDRESNDDSGMTEDNQEEPDIKHNISLRKKLKDIKTFIADRENRTAIASVFNVIIKLIRHVFPRKIQGRIVYGLDDPYLTAKILEFFALLYSFMGDALTVIPLWDELKLECDLSFTGRISIIYTIFQFCRLRLNRNCMRLWRKYHGK